MVEANPGSIELISDVPTPGSPVLIRLRDTALEYILEHPDAWSIICPDGELTAGLQIPPPAEPAQATMLTVINPGKPETTDRVVILDRGENPEPCSLISLEFNSPELLTTVLPSAGPTRDSFPQLGVEQVVIQKVSQDGVLRLTEIRFSPSVVNRYIRLLIRNGGDHAVSRASSRMEEQQPDLFEVPVALGPLHSLPGGNGNMWPLMLSTNRLPLRKLKIVSDANGEYRHIRLLRIDENMHELSEEANMVYAGSVSANGKSRTENYMVLPGRSAPEPLALLIHDGNGSLLPLQSIKAYCAEVYISLNWPESGMPRLSSQSTSHTASIKSADNAILAGTFSSMDTEQTVVTDTGQAQPRRRSDLSQLNLQRFIPRISLGHNVLFPLAGVLLLAGFGLLLAVRLRDLRE